MNEDTTDLERELRRLQPVPPSERLQHRLADFLDESEVAVQPQRAPWWQRLGFNRPAAALGWGLFSPVVATGAAAVLVGYLRPGGSLPSPPAPSTMPASELAAKPDIPRGAKAVNVLYQTLDEGVVLDGAQEPVRRVRYRSADRVRWHNPQTGAQWEVSYPREDVLLIPVQAE